MATLRLAKLLRENKFPASMLMNRALVERVGEIPEESSQDHWIALVAFCLGTIAYLPESLVLYRRHGTSMSGGSSARSLLARLSRWVRHGTVDYRKMVSAQIVQAERLLEAHRESLSGEKRRLLEDFVSLQKISWWRRRIICAKHRICRSGFLTRLADFFLLG